MSTNRIIFSFFLLLHSITSFSQVISPLLYGQNAWMPKAIGSYVVNGSLDKHWGKLQACGIKFVRVGGTSNDGNLPTNAQFIALVDSIRKIGAEPLLQVPYNNGAFSETTAANTVRYLNVTMGRNVKYWTIANEPDGNFSMTIAAPIAAYFKRFATAMKLVDPTIKIVGPDLTYLYASIYSSLIGGADDITGKDANGNYMIDVVAFHCYRGYSGTQTRTNVTTDAPAKFKTDATNVTGYINTANSKNARNTVDTKLTWAVTEFNVNYKNPTTNDAAGVGSHGFVNGQYWAECLGYAMQYSALAFMPWCVHESSGNRTSYDIGFLDGVNGQYPRSSYYHLQLLAKNNKANFATSTDNNQALVKVISSKDNSGTTVVILNEELTTTFAYTVRLDLSTVTGTNALKINVDKGQAIQYTPTTAIPAQGTHVLVFDNLGNIQKIIEYTLTDAQHQVAPRVIFTGSTSAISVTNSNEQNFGIYQSDNQMNFDFTELEMQRIFQFKIHNLSGQTIYSTSLQPPFTKLTVGNGLLKQGVYISSIQGEGMRLWKKFMVM